jgi:hypothetical protein
LKSFPGPPTDQTRKRVCSIDHYGHPTTSSRLPLEGPSIDLRFDRLRQANTPCGMPPSAHSCHRMVTFRPHDFSPSRRFAPASRRRHCCSLQPILGFIAFQRLRRLHDPSEEGSPSAPRPLPAMHTPPEDSTCRQRLPRSPPIP